MQLTDRQTDRLTASFAQIHSTLKEKLLSMENSNRDSRVQAEKVPHLEKRCHDLQEELDESRRTNKDAMKQVQSTQAELNKLVNADTKLKSSKEEVASLKQQLKTTSQKALDVERLQGRVVALEMELRERNSLVDRLQVDSTQLGEVTQELRTVTHKLADTESELQRWRSRCEEETERGEKEREALRQARIVLDEETSSRRRLEWEKSDNVRTVERYEKDLADGRHKVESLNSEIRDCTDRIEKLTRQKENLNEIISGLKQDAVATVSRAQQWEERCDQAAKERDAVKDEVKTLRDRLEKTVLEKKEAETAVEIEKREYRHLEEKNSEISSTLSSWEKRIHQMEEALRKTESLLSDSHKQVASSNAERDRLQQDLVKALGQVENLKEQENTLNGKLVDIGRSADNWQARKTEMQQEIGSLSAEVERLQLENAQSHQRYSELEHLLNEYTHAMMLHSERGASPLRAEKSASSPLSEGITDRLRAVMDAERNRIHELESELSGARKRVHDLTTENAELQASLTQVTDDLEKSAAQASDQATLDAQEISMLHEKLEDTSRQLNNERGSRQKAERELAASVADLSSLRDESEQSIHRSHSDLEQLKHSLEQEKSQLESQTAHERSQWESKVSEMKKMLTRMDAEKLRVMEEKDVEIRSYADQITQLQDSISELQSSLEESEQSVQRAHQESKELEKQLHSTRERVEKKSAQVLSLQGATKDLEAHIEDLQSEIDQLRSKCSELQVARTQSSFEAEVKYSEEKQALESEISHLQKSIEGYKKQEDVWRRELHAISGVEQSMQERTDLLLAEEKKQASDVIHKLQETVSMLREKLTDVEKQLQIVTSEKANLSAKLVEAQQASQEDQQLLESCAAQMESSAAAFRKEMQELQQVAETWEERCQVLTQEKASLVASHRGSEVREKQLLEQLHKAEDYSKVVLDAVGEKEKDLQTLRESLKAVGSQQDRIQLLLKNQEKLSKENDRLRNIVTPLERVNRTLERSLEEAESKLEHLSQQANQAQSQEGSSSLNVTPILVAIQDTLAVYQEEVERNKELSLPLALLQQFVDLERMLRQAVIRLQEGDQISGPEDMLDQLKALKADLRERDRTMQKMANELESANFAAAEAQAARQESPDTELRQRVTELQTMVSSNTEKYQKLEAKNASLIQWLENASAHIQRLSHQVAVN